MIPGERVESVAREFCVQGEFRNVERYGSGHIHDTYCVTYEGQVSTRLIVQRVNSSIFPDPSSLMGNIERVTEHLRLKLRGKVDVNRRVLQLVATTQGRNWHVDSQGQYWRAYGFIDGARTFDVVTSRAQAFEAAKAFGTFQSMLADLPQPRLTEIIKDFHNTPRRLAAMEAASDADIAGRCGEAEKEVAFVRSRREIASALLNAGLPERVTHNDTKLNNVLLDEATGEGICVIDLDTVMPGLAAYDFGDMVRTMTSPAEEDERDLKRVEMDFVLFESVLRGYLEGAGGFLMKRERESLIAGAKVIVLEQAIRFLTDFLAGDTYYKVNRPQQNLDRARVQFRLLESIERQEAAMRELLSSLT